MSLRFRSDVRRRLRLSVQNPRPQTFLLLLLLRLRGDVTGDDAGQEAESGQDGVDRRQQPPERGREGAGETEVEGVQREEDPNPAASTEETQTESSRAQ